MKIKTETLSWAEDAMYDTSVKIYNSILHCIHKMI